MVYAGLAIYDTMQFIRPDVQTICVGHGDVDGRGHPRGGDEGKRSALPHSKILIHQGSAGFSGQPTDIEIQAREVISLKRLMEEIMSKHTGQTIEKIAKDMDRDYYMTATEAQGVRDHRPGDRAPRVARLQGFRAARIRASESWPCTN